MHTPPRLAYAAIACILLAVIGTASAQRRSEVQPTILIVQTLPRAEILLGKVPQGRTDGEGYLIIRRIKPGDHVLEVTFPGKQPFSKTVRVPANRTTRFRADLLDYTADLEVYTAPEAEVSVDRKPMGVADASGRLLVRGLAALNYYRLHCARTGFNSAEREFRLTPGMLNTITLDLKPIEVQVEPPATAAPRYQQERTLTMGTNSIGQMIGVSDAIFTADGLVVGWESRKIAVWEPDTGRQVRTAENRHGLDVQAVSLDMKWSAVREIVAVKDEQQGIHLTLLVDVETGKVVQQHPGYYEMAFAPDSKQIVIRHPDRRTTYLYDISSGKAIQTWKEYEMGQFTFSPDGRLLAASGADGVTIRDTETGQAVQSWDGGGVALRFSPDGRWLAVLGSRAFRQTTGHVGTIELREARTRKQGRIIETPDILKDGVFTSDSRRMITLSENSIQTWNLATGIKENDWPVKYARGVVLSSDDAWMAVIGEHLTLWRRQ